MTETPLKRGLDFEFKFATLLWWSIFATVLQYFQKQEKNGFILAPIVLKLQNFDSPLFLYLKLMKILETLSNLVLNSFGYFIYFLDKIVIFAQIYSYFKDNPPTIITK